MANTFVLDLKNTHVSGVSVLPQTISSATTVNGDPVDLRDAEGSVHLVVLTGDCGDSTLTLNVKLQESDTSGGTYTDVAEGAAPALTGATAADKKSVLLSTWFRTKRWVRVQVTTAGSGTLSVPISAAVLSVKKIIGSGTGYAA